MTVAVPGPAIEASGVGAGLGFYVGGFIIGIWPLVAFGIVLTVVSAWFQLRYYERERRNHWKIKCGPRCMLCEELAKEIKRKKSGTSEDWKNYRRWLNRMGAVEFVGLVWIALPLLFKPRLFLRPAFFLVGFAIAILVGVSMFVMAHYKNKLRKKEEKEGIKA